MMNIRCLALAAALATLAGGCGPTATPVTTQAPKIAAPVAHDVLMSSYDRGLDFLASKTTGGVVSVRGTPFTGVTGFCLLRFLERPGGAREKDKAVVDQMLAYVAKSIRADGAINTGPTATYDASVILMALVDAKRPEYAPQIERLVKHIKSVQHTDPSHEGYGGMGGFAGDPRADLGITYFALMALEMAGVPKDDAVYRHALAYGQRVQNRKANETPGEPTHWSVPQLGNVVRGDDGGASAYPGWSKAGLEKTADGMNVMRSSASMTYSLLHCYHIIGLPPADGRLAAAFDWISNHWAVDVNPGMPDEFPERQKRDGVFYYYAAVAKTLPAIGIDKLRTKAGTEIDWRAELATAVIAQQKADGSWQSQNVQWSESVSVIATTYSLIALAGCAR